MKKPKSLITMKGLHTRVGSLEGRMVEVERKQDVADGKLDAQSDKLDLLINLQTAKMAARTRLITALLTAIGTVIGAITGAACL